MQQSVSHPDDLPPGEIGHLRLADLRYATSRFADDLDESLQRAGEHVVVFEIGANSPLNCRSRLSGAVEHVAEENIIIRRRHRYPAPPGVLGHGNEGSESRAYRDPPCSP